MTDITPTPPPPLPPAMPAATLGGPPASGDPGPGRPPPTGRSKLTDEQLLKRAGYGGKSLLALAVLAGLASLGLGIASDRAQQPAGLETYRQAVARWRTALQLLQPADADLAAALDQLQRGDRLRLQAFQEFDRRYVRAKPQTDDAPSPP